MLSRRNLVIAGVLILIVVAAGIYLRQQRIAEAQAAQAALRQEVVGRGTLVSTVSATGYLAPQHQVNLFFSAASPLPVTQVNVALGQAVKKGDALAVLDTTDLELAVVQAEQALRAAQLGLEQLQAPPRSEDLAVAEANLRIAQAQVYAASQGNSTTTVEIARLNLLLAQAALDQTHRTMDELIRQGKFAEKQALEAQEEQQIENAKIADLRYQAAQQPPGTGRAASASAAVEQAQAALDRLKNGPSQEDLEIAQLRVSQARAALEVARHNLEQAQIIAPFDGVIAAVNIRAGDPSTGSGDLSALPAIVLADVDRFYLDVPVDEVDVASVAVGQAVTITLDALPNALLSGQVQKIAPSATNNAGVVSYPVRLILNPADAPLRGGMTATAEIVIAEARDVVLVPNWAIRRDRDTGQAYVGILRNGSVEDVPVALGLRNETFSEVRNGVRVGEVVAVDTRREELSLFDGG
ncbi:MAG: efflux RND transporter periplasmic adaptor subunit [Anaerolineales bacterium]